MSEPPPKKRLKVRLGDKTHRFAVSADATVEEACRETEKKEAFVALGVKRKIRTFETLPSKEELDLAERLRDLIDDDEVVQPVYDDEVLQPLFESAVEAQPAAPRSAEEGSGKPSPARRGAFSRAPDRDPSVGEGAIVTEGPPSSFEEDRKDESSSSGGRGNETRTTVSYVVGSTMSHAPKRVKTVQAVKDFKGLCKAIAANEETEGGVLLFDSEGHELLDDPSGVAALQDLLGSNGDLLVIVGVPGEGSASNREVFAQSPAWQPEVKQKDEVCVASVLLEHAPLVAIFYDARKPFAQAIATFLSTLFVLGKHAKTKVLRKSVRSNPLHCACVRYPLIVPARRKGAQISVHLAPASARATCNCRFVRSARRQENLLGSEESDRCHVVSLHQPPAPR
jgi:hypothetical protein